MHDQHATSRRRLLTVAGASAGLAGLTGTVTARGFGRGRRRDRRPVVFVHGGFGSATQFESQAMRFASNGYPDDHLAVFEYNSLSPVEENESDIVSGLDARIDALLDETGADRVDAIGHSRGTTVMHAYLADESRAEKVAKYVNLDGREGESPPGGVETLAVWGIGNLDAEYGGAQNFYADDQTHVQVATSRETFGAMYEFLTGREPWTTRIVPEPSSRTTVAGRAALFPQNEGIDDATLEVYEIDAETGHRRDDEPVEREELDGDGSWGPYDLDVTERHEFAIRREDGQDHHVYRLPPVRSNHFVRLLAAEEGGLLDQFVETGPDHVTLSLSRDKEFWGDQAETDSLTIDGTEVINEATAPREDRVIAPIVYDAGADGETDVSRPIPTFTALPFITGLDVHLPAADPPDDTVTLVERPRDGDVVREVNLPNWPSDDHSVSVHFPDHTQQRLVERLRHRRWRRRRWLREKVEEWTSE